MLFYRKRIKAQLAELEGRVDALEDAFMRLRKDYDELDKNLCALWRLYKEKVFKPEQEQKPKPKKRRPTKNGKETPDSAK